MSGLSHLDSRGRATMVDVGGKGVTRRYARAWGKILLQPETLAAISERGIAKGDVFAAARLAGIMAAKRTGELIPLCHPLPLDWAGVELLGLAPAGNESRARIIIVGEAGLAGRTGVEMEALTAVTVAGLTIYDMCKARDREMSLEAVGLLEKKGGRSGHYFAPGRAFPLVEAGDVVLEAGSAVFWSLAEGELEFRRDQPQGRLCGRVTMDVILTKELFAPESVSETVFCLGDSLLVAVADTAHPDGGSGGGCLRVEKPGRIGPDALFAFLG
ncbi:MAG: cyclic pyranopterin monophosphate synthase MoaC [Deltaproteobacteria bacterium]|nr:cyclic pyranopterin monophosphate synthase MoaC [Deltaproteobacteria bacterium]